MALTKGVWEQLPLKNVLSTTFHIHTHAHRHTQSTQRHIERQRRLVTAVSVIRERTPKISTVCDIYCRIVYKQRVKSANVLSFDCRVLIDGK